MGAAEAAEAEVQAAALAAEEIEDDDDDEDIAPSVASQSETAVVGEELSGQPGARLGRFRQALP